MSAAGLVEVPAGYLAGSYPGGSIPSRLLSLTVERLRVRMVHLGADSSEIDEARRLVEDPGRMITSPTTCVAQGRRPGAAFETSRAAGSASAGCACSGQDQDRTRPNTPD
jgi:hypothetical protein